MEYGSSLRLPVQSRLRVEVLIVGNALLLQSHGTLLHPLLDLLVRIQHLADPR
jgi:hypothetical protein